MKFKNVSLFRSNSTFMHQGQYPCTIRWHSHKQRNPSLQNLRMKKISVTLKNNSVLKIGKISDLLDPKLPVSAHCQDYLDEWSKS